MSNAGRCSHASHSIQGNLVPQGIESDVGWLYLLPALLIVLNIGCSESPCLPEILLFTLSSFLVCRCQHQAKINTDYWHGLSLFLSIPCINASYRCCG